MSSFSVNVQLPIAWGITWIIVSVLIAYQTTRYKLKSSAKTDQRVRLSQEILTAIRIIKFYTWENFFTDSVNRIRKKEVYQIRLLGYLEALVYTLGTFSTKTAFFICIMSYSAFGYHVSPEKAFVVTGSFSTVTSLISIQFPIGLYSFAELKAAIIRISDFLRLEESESNRFAKSSDPKISIDSVSTVSNVLRDVTLQVAPGLTAVTGSVGSGKTSLLKLILGDLEKIKGEVRVQGRVSYASQEPWLFPATIKQNITFGEPFDAKRYWSVITACCLNKDISDLPRGDATRIIDKGLNLSRGQKTRINLARAVYKEADIYLIDDSLTAVDARVSGTVFDGCFKQLLKDKLCLLVTHNSDIIRRCNHVVVFDEGSIQYQGVSSEIGKLGRLGGESRPDDLIEETQDYPKLANGTERSSTETSKLLNDSGGEAGSIYSETVKEGVVDKEVFMQYLKFGGGVTALLIILATISITQVMSSWIDYFVSDWVDMEQKLMTFAVANTTGSDEYADLVQSNTRAMRFYLFLIMAFTVALLFRAGAFLQYCALISMRIHKSAFDNLVNASLSFFDRHLSGNIVNRLTRDLGVVDDVIPYTAYGCFDTIFSVSGALYIICSINPMFIIPSLIFAIIVICARQFYVPTSRSIQRLEGSTRSPIIGHINASLEGLTTIRANNAEAKLAKGFDSRQNLFNSVTYMSLTIVRVFAFYLSLLRTCFMGVITFSFLLFKNDTSAGKIGLAITECYSLTGILQWGVQVWTDLENEMTSVERILEYTKVEKEDRSGRKQLPDWPNNGRVVFKGVNLRYSATSGNILRDITFSVESGEKIGVVGRTGAGKSSIVSLLFHFYDYSGEITIDGVDIKTLDVTELRQKISIIPQDPVLFTGTLRDNLDPKSMCTDRQLWSALEKVEMKQSFNSLNYQIDDGGLNFSVGQRQLICLARAIVRTNKILILDEATSNMDPKTDEVMQKIIKNNFGDYTIITIAHRLNTVIDSDKILVVDSGRIAQFGAPKALLKDREGLFFRMVDRAGIL